MLSWAGTATFEEISGGTSALQFPALRQLQLVTQRVWTFVACFVQSRRVNTLFECHQAFLQHEGVREFAELRLGNSFLHTEAVQTLYHSPVAMPAITTRDILTHLQQFETLLNRDVFRGRSAAQPSSQSSRIELGEFMQYLAQQYRQPRSEAIGVMIDPSGFGVYIGMLRRIGNHEMKELKTLEQEFHKGIAEKVFQLTKDKFSVENRKQALDDLLSAQQERQQEQSTSGDGSASRRKLNAPSAAVLASISSLSLDLLNRVTEVDVYLDNVLRRKAANFERAQREQPNQKQYRGKPISSQAIAETDLKIRNQMTRFLVSSPQSKHHSRLKVVTWVLCGIMAKIHALLLNDDKMPAGGDAEDAATSGGSRKKSADSSSSARGGADDSDDGEECDCCCVGKDACRCSCQCECHADSGDEHESDVVVVDPDESSCGNAEQSSTQKPDDSSAELKQRTSSTAITPKFELGRELHDLLSAHVNSESVQTGKQLLEELVRLETTAMHTFGDRWPLRDSQDGKNATKKSLLQVLGALTSGEDESVSGVPSGHDDDGGVDTSEWLHFLEHSQLVDKDDVPLGAPHRGADSLPALGVVLEFVAQCQRTIASSASLSAASVDRRLQWIEHRVCVEFGCSSFEALGVGGLNSVIAMVSTKTDASSKQTTTLSVKDTSATRSNIIKYSNALALTENIGEALLLQSNQHGSTRGLQSGESMCLRLLTQQAVEHVLACPFVVVDVAQFTNWREQYAPALGSLRSFVCTHEIILLDHASRSTASSLSQTSSLMFVACQNGDLIRLNESASASDLELHARNATARASPVSARFVATTLVSLYVTCGGGSDFPMQLVQVHVRSLVAAAAEREGKHDRDGHASCQFALDVLSSTPADFRPFMCDVLQQAILASVSSPASTFGEQLWRASSSDAERAMLIMLDRRGALSLSESQRIAWSKQAQGATTSDANDGDAVLPNATTSRNDPATGDTADHRQGMQFDGENKPTSESSEVVSAYFNSNVTRTDDDGVAMESSSPSAQLSLTEDSTESCKAFIEDLRRQQFGVGLEIQDEAARAVLGIQRKRLERALKRLSDELYSENTHFVLELLQNADDNAYDADVVPSGEFTLTSANEIVFYNNEAGFSRANIRAICDVGASTKEGDVSSRSIGKKGIGFKSVFKVSDVPEVHSNGFHIRFRAHDNEYGGGMGYILPHWVDDGGSVPSAWSRRRGTTFVLPLNAGSAQRTTEISQSLLTVEPSTLLFLHRIRALRIFDDVRNASAQFLKTETRAVSTGDHHVVELYSRSTVGADDCQPREGGTAAQDTTAGENDISKQRWLVVKSQLKVAQAFIDTGRPSETEVAVAIPFDPSSGGESLEQRPPLQQVFAYLPLRSYGFHFIIQGDFEVPSSREAIINGSEWNQWLISKLPALVVKAVNAFAREALATGCNPSTWVSVLTSLLPLEAEVQAPFRTAVADTMRALRLAHWLPCLSVSKKESDHEQEEADGRERQSDHLLLRPIDVLDCSEVMNHRALARIDDDDGDSDEDKSPIISPLSDDLLTSAFSKRQLHPTVAAAMSASLRRQLQIEQLHCSHIMRLLALSPSRNDMSWTVAMFVLLSRLWKRERHSQLLLQELRLIRCFPLRGDATAWVSLAETNDAIYFAPSRSTDGRTTQQMDSSPQESRVLPHANAFVSELHLLHEAFSAQALDTPEARAFLTRHVGVKTVDEHDVIANHILPEMEAACASNSSLTRTAVSPTRMLEFAAVLASHVASCGGSQCPLASDIRSKFCTLTSTNSFMCARSDDAEASLAVLMPSTSRELPVVEPWMLRRIEQTDEECDDADASRMKIVSSRYFALPSVSEAAWRTLFVDVCHLPELFGCGSSATPASVLRLSAVLQWIENENDVHLRALVSMQLAQYIDRHWLTDAKVLELLEKETEAQGDADATSDAAFGSASAIAQVWRSHRWLKSSSKEWYRSTDLWLKTRKTEALFSSEMVPFCSYAWRHEKFATDVLGLKNAPSVDDVVHVLLNLSGSSSKPNVSVASVSPLYAYLWKHLEDATSDVRDATSAHFASSNLLLARSEVDGSSVSEWVGCGDAVWSSTTYNGSLIALEELYPSTLREFFHRICGVSRKPSTLFLCKQLTRHSMATIEAGDGESTKESKKTEKTARKKLRRRWEQKVWPLLNELAVRLRKGSVAKDDVRALKKSLKASAWLPLTLVGSADGSTGYVTSSSSGSQLRPARAVTETDRKMAKCIVALSNAATATGCIDDARDQNEKTRPEIAVVDLDESRAAELDPLFELARLPPLSVDLVAHASEWSDALARISHVLHADDAAGPSVDTSKPTRTLQKKFRKLMREVVTTWARVFSDDPHALSDEFRSSIQRARVFPALPSSSVSTCYATPVELYLNDQVELEEDVFRGRQGALITGTVPSAPTSSLSVLSLFPWAFFTSDAEVNGGNGRAIAQEIQNFLVECCGVKSLRANMTHEVVALGTQRPASVALHEAVRSSLAIAQRVLFHNHRSRYDRLPHTDLRRLADAIKCVVVEGPDALQIVYRIDNAFSYRVNASDTTNADGSKRGGVFWDGDSATLYLSHSTSDADDTRDLFAILMELARKLFGALQAVASSVANVLYLASLQRNARERERWLVTTQQVPALPSSEDERRWLSDEISDDDEGDVQVEARGTKRSLNELEDGEIDDNNDATAMKRSRVSELMGQPSDAVAPYSQSASHPGDWNGPLSSASTRATAGWSGSFPPTGSAAPPLPPPLPMPPSSSQLAAPPSTMMGNTLTVEERAAVGRWGEEYVYKQLADAHRDKPELRVTWVNEEEESGLPYDIAVSSASTGAIVEYVEVKSTRTMEKGVFEISMNELDQAAVHGSTYSIYRVFNAGDAARCRVIRMKNPVSLVRQKKIQLALVMQ